MSNLRKPLIFKASEHAKGCFPQSYPQFFGKTFKALQNQGLRDDLKNFDNLQN
jgi:hypothetical protein